MGLTCKIVTALSVLAIGLWWPWDGIDTREEGEYSGYFPDNDGTKDIPQGWLFAPFGMGPNMAVGAAFMMQLVPLEPAQRLGCQLLTPNPSDYGQQIYMGIYLKGISSAAAALRRFPDSKELQRVCIRSAAMSCLFNRHTTVKAGKAGLVELFTAGFKRFKTDPGFQALGDLGCLFDHSPENIKRFAAIGGLPFVHEMINAHYWNSYVQFMAFCAYSSGCTRSSNILCATEPGLIETMVKVMKDHRKERVREEIMQVIKSISSAGPTYQKRMADEGMVPQLVQVLQERTDSKTDQSVGCEALASLISTSVARSGIEAENATFVFEMQTLLTEEGALDQVLSSIDLGGKLTLGEGFGGQNAFALQQYNIERSCFQTLHKLAWRNPTNQDTLVRRSVPKKIAAALENHPQDEGMAYWGCLALEAIAGDGGTSKLDSAIGEATSKRCASVLLSN